MHGRKREKVCELVQREESKAHARTLTMDILVLMAELGGIKKELGAYAIGSLS